MIKDILVIGTGISGLTFAIKVAEENPKLSLTLISKMDILSKSSPTDVPIVRPMVTALSILFV